MVKFGTTTLIDLIVTTKPNLINRKGVVPLGLLDHCLIYATLNLKLNRPPPNVVMFETTNSFRLISSELISELHHFRSLRFLRIRGMFSGHGTKYSKLVAIYMHL